MRTNQLTPLALVVLQLLQERAMHPYEMQQLIRDRRIDRFVKVRAGSLYHTVERLHRVGLIEPVETGRAGRRPERTVYALTPDGRDEFHESLRAIVSRPAVEYPIFGSAMEMLHALEPSDAADLLERRAIELDADTAALDQVLASLDKRGLARIEIVEVEYARAMRQAELTWVRGLVDDIRAGTLVWHATGTKGEPGAAHHSEGKQAG